MIEKYLYFTKARIFVILLTIASLVGVVIQLGEVSNLQDAIFNLLITFSLTVILAWLEGEWVQHPPKDTREIIEYNGANFSLTNAIGKATYDKDGNELGLCTGAYFTKDVIRLMVGGHLYDVNEVYFEVDEYDEQ